MSWLWTKYLVCWINYCIVIRILDDFVVSQVFKTMSTFYLLLYPIPLNFREWGTVYLHLYFIYFAFTKTPQSLITHNLWTVSFQYMCDFALIATPFTESYPTPWPQQWALWNAWKSPLLMWLLQSNNAHKQKYSVTKTGHNWLQSLAPSGFSPHWRHAGRIVDPKFCCPNK